MQLEMFNRYFTFKWPMIWGRFKWLVTDFNDTLQRVICYREESELKEPLEKGGLMDQNKLNTELDGGIAPVDQEHIDWLGQVLSPEVIVSLIWSFTGLALFSIAQGRQIGLKIGALSLRIV